MSFSPELETTLLHFIEKEKLPSTYLQTVEQWFIPLAQKIEHQLASHSGTFILGIHGCQGSGKSTLAALLVLVFKEMFGISSINLSLDNFYLTRSEREILASKVHPLLITRGVPGTHDIELAIQTLMALQQNELVSIPQFDKALDDRMPESKWQKIESPVDLIIMEGWCLGVGAQEAADLNKPVNELETNEDKGEWRSYVNQQLENDYPTLFKMIDMYIMLKAPDFSDVLNWRLQQENKLRTKNTVPDENKIMNKEELIHFISHYERLTRHALKTMPAIAEVVYQLNTDQSIQSKLKG